MSKLTAAARKAIPASKFAGPDRSYPIPDAGHAKVALSDASKFASSDVKAKVRAKVRADFPSMSIADMVAPKTKP